MTKQLRADLMLIMITVIWGASYMLTKIGLQTLEPFNLTALRFIIAFIVSAVVFYKNILKADIETIKYAFILALILFAVFAAQTFGLKYTSASIAGFLISLAVVFIPIISSVFLKQKIEKNVLTGICLALIGTALLTLNSQLRVGSGDLLCLLSALLFAVHVIVTGIFTKKVDSVSLSVLQLGFVGLLNIIFSLFTETTKLPSDRLTWFAILGLSILCTAVGYIVQATSQQYTNAVHTGLIFSLEPVFSAIYAYLILKEVLPTRGYIGAGILLLSVLVAELDFESKDKSSNEDMKTT